MDISNPLMTVFTPAIHTTALSCHPKCLETMMREFKQSVANTKMTQIVAAKLYIRLIPDEARRISLL